MSRIVQCKTVDGREIAYVDEVIGSGAMKDVYFAPDKSYVVAFYRQKQDAQARERLQMITGRYREGIFDQEGGEYWKRLFCWPTAMVEHDGRIGIVAPTYAPNFFFAYGSRDNDRNGIRGKEKEGKWFAAPNLRNRYVDPRELGDWRNHLRICLLLARAVRRLHMAGLAHSDLSYKNVLVDPTTGESCVIDVDGLVVPNRYPPDVVGTPDFIAPEVVKTSHLDKNDPRRMLPRRETDLHALAVLIYMYLLYRHPLRGRKVHDANDSGRDEQLSMGERALFVEHATDQSNRIDVAAAKKTELPWADTSKIPYTVTGPYLSVLFERSFVKGLHDPSERPSANDWETALVKTVDLLQPCLNPACGQKWYIFNNSTRPRCPFCGTPFVGNMPILNLYSSRRQGSFRPDNHRLIVYTEQSLFWWHASLSVAPNERLHKEQRRRVGYFVRHDGAWWLVNEALPDLIDMNTSTPVAVGSKLQLQEGKQLLLSKGDGARLALVQMVTV
jgi:serine/threonine protein kinase